MSEIDVSKCKFSNSSGDCTSPINKSNTKCEKVPIDWCYFKQLRAKEEECKKLQFTLKHVGLLDLMNENNELKQECEALEKRVQAEIHLRNKYVNLFKKARGIYLRTSKGNLRLVSENEDLKDTIKRFTCQAECYKHKEADKYKQALDEIEKFIKNQLDGFGNDVYSMDKSAINSIQDIINKAKEE